MAYQPTVKIFKSLKQRTTTANNTKQTLVNSACFLTGFSVVNTNTTSQVIFVKFYDHASPTAADAPFLVERVEATSTGRFSLSSPIDITTAVSVRAVTGIDDANVTNPTNNPFITAFYYL